jgi:DNA-binding Lrp family transcriptional regulator
MGQAASPLKTIPKPKKLTPERSWRDRLPIHPAANMPRPMNDRELERLGGDIRRRGLQSKIVLTRAKQPDDTSKVFVLDGRSRLDAIEGYVGFELFDSNGEPKEEYFRYVDVPDGNYRAYVATANLHRRHLDRGEQRELAKKILAAEPEKSDRQIGRIVGLSQPTVSNIRKQAEKSGDVKRAFHVMDSNRRKQPRKRKAKPSRAKSETIKTETAPPGKIVTAWRAATQEDRDVFIDLFGEDVAKYGSKRRTAASPPTASEPDKMITAEVAATIPAPNPICDAWHKSADQAKQVFLKEYGADLAPYMPRDDREKDLRRLQNEYLALDDDTRRRFDAWLAGEHAKRRSALQEMHQ